MTPLTWHEEERHLWDLKDTGYNPRRVSKKAFDTLVESIKTSGYHDRIICDVDGTILSGHQRKRALLHIYGARNPKIKVLAPSSPLSKEQRDEILIRANVSAGEWDFDLLSSNFEIDMLKDCGVTLNIEDMFSPTSSISTDPETPSKQTKKEVTCPACGFLIEPGQ